MTAVSTHNQKKDILKSLETERVHITSLFILYVIGTYFLEMFCPRVAKANKSYLLNGANFILEHGHFQVGQCGG